MILYTQEPSKVIHNQLRKIMDNLIASLSSFQIIKWDLVLGGFGLFLYGIKFMGDGLKAVVG